MRTARLQGQVPAKKQNTQFPEDSQKQRKKWSVKLHLPERPETGRSVPTGKRNSKGLDTRLDEVSLALQ